MRRFFAIALFATAVACGGRTTSTATDAGADARLEVAIPSSDEGMSQDPGQGQDQGQGQDPGQGQDQGQGQDPGIETDPGLQEDPGAGGDPGTAGDPGTIDDPGATGDAGADTAQDVPVADNPGVPADGLPLNGGFEDWTDGDPDHWLGSESTLSYVIQDASSPHGGKYACRLSNPDDGHERFTTEAAALAAGAYSCTYFVRGHGDLRNGHFHGLSGNGFSSYEPSGYWTLASDAWEKKTYAFKLPSDAPAFQLIFSFRGTDPDQGDLSIDDVSCVRLPSACDAAPCDATWSQCDEATATCVAKAGFCDADGDCFSWEACGADHECAVVPGKCAYKSDCLAIPATPVCDVANHVCIPGDPCADVTCAEWKQCDPATAQCVVKDGRCDTSADCRAPGLPACDAATRSCVDAEAACNVLKGGGFETWVEDAWGHTIPEGWFGMDIPGATEIDPKFVTPVTDAPHGGLTACRIEQAAVPDRFTTVSVDLPVGTYTCAYWVRGHGGIRHRYYSSGGWSVEFPQDAIDSTEWEQRTFKVQGNVHDFRFIFYAGYTLADKGHVQIDDVVCTKD